MASGVTERVRPGPARAPAVRSPARTALSGAIAALRAASGELAAAQSAASRLAAILGEAARREAEMTQLRAAEEKRLGRWLAQDSDEPRPRSGAVIAAAKQPLTEIAEDAAAAQAALPDAEQAFHQCAARVRELQRRRDEAVCIAAVEAARDFAQTRLSTALAVALAHEAVLHGLRDELLRRGNRADAWPGALEAAARVGEAIHAAKRAASARRNAEPALRLLAALVDDPDAELAIEAGR
jgi:hypothetical protein